jgi:hypothetical protein
MKVWMHLAASDDEVASSTGCVSHCLNVHERTLVHTARWKLKALREVEMGQGCDIQL